MATDGGRVGRLSDLSHLINTRGRRIRGLHSPHGAHGANRQEGRVSLAGGGDMSTRKLEGSQIFLARSSRRRRKPGTHASSVRRADHAARVRLLRGYVGHGPGDQGAALAILFAAALRASSWYRMPGPSGAGASRRSTKSNEKGAGRWRSRVATRSGAIGDRGLDGDRVGSKIAGAWRARRRAHRDRDRGRDGGRERNDSAPGLARNGSGMSAARGSPALGSPARRSSTARGSPRNDRRARTGRARGPRDDRRARPARRARMPPREDRHRARIGRSGVRAGDEGRALQASADVSVAVAAWLEGGSEGAAVCGVEGGRLGGVGARATAGPIGAPGSPR